MAMLTFANSRRKESEMAKVSAKSRSATSAPKTRQGQRETWSKRTITCQTDTAPDMPHEQERGEAKRRPGARNATPRRATARGRNVQQEKKGKMSPARADVYEKSRNEGPRTGKLVARRKSSGLGKAARKPRLGKSAKKGSRRSRSPSVRKNTRK